MSRSIIQSFITSNPTFTSASSGPASTEPNAVPPKTPLVASSQPLPAQTLEKRYWSPKRMMEAADAKRKRVDFHSAQLAQLITADIVELRDIAQENVEFCKETSQRIYKALFEWIQHNGVPSFDVRSRVTHAQRMQFAAGFGVYLADTDSELYELGSLASMSIIRACDQWIENHRIKLDALDEAGIPERTAGTAIRTSTIRDIKKARNANFESDN
jgi:hypothetical protein